MFVFFATTAHAEELTIMAVGDILPNPSWEHRDIPVEKLFDGVAETFFWADVVVGNLETPLTDRPDPTTVKQANDLDLKKEFVFKADAPGVAQALKDAGFTVLTLANNHMLDYQEGGSWTRSTGSKARGY